MENKLKAYQELYAVAEKNKEHLNPYLLDSLCADLKEKELSVMFQLPLTIAGNTWYKVSNFYKEWVNVGLYGEETSRTISCEDNKKQPQGEWLYALRFCTGAYIFGDCLQNNYPTETFNAFFQELKGFEPKYCDSMNSALYFTSENAHKVHEQILPLFQKYKTLVVHENSRKRVKELEAELAKLKEKK